MALLGRAFLFAGYCLAGEQKYLLRFFNLNEKILCLVRAFVRDYRILGEIL